MNKIVYDDYAVGAREDAHCVMNETDQQLYNGEDVYSIGSIFKNTAASDYASFDDGGIDLTRSVHLYSVGSTPGFVSDRISGINGVFSTPPKMTIGFDSGNYYSGNGIALTFNTHYCTSLRVTYYADNTQLGEARTYTGLQSMYVYLPAVVDGYNKIVIEFLETQYPNQYVMVGMVEFGKTHELTKMHSLEYHKKLYFDCSDIAIGTLDAVFQSDEELNLLRNQRLRVYHRRNDGDVYDLIGTYWVADAERQTDKLYSITAEDVFRKADDVSCEPLFSARRTNNLKLSTPLSRLTADTDIPVTVNSHLGNVQTNGFFGGGTYRKLLAELMFSTQNFIKANADASITVFSIPSSVTKQINGSDILGEATFTKTQRPNAVKVSFTEYDNPIIESEKTVYSGTIPESGVDIPVDFPVWGTPSIIKKEDGNTIDVTLHYVKIALNRESIDGDLISPYGFRVGAVSIDYATDDVDVLYYPYQGNTVIMSELKDISSSEERAEKNYGTKSFYTTDRQAKAEILLERLFSARGTVKAAYIGGDLDVGDYVSVETKYNGTMYGTVTEITGDVGYRDTIQNVVITVWQ